MNKQPFYNMSGRMTVSDPCYSPGTWCAGVVNVLRGRWFGSVIKSDEGSWGARVACLVAHHEDMQAPDRNDGRWARLDIDVGVDSGQAGFFDTAQFVGSDYADGVDFDNPKTFYDHCCHATLADEQWGAVLDFGVVSSSGFGDGGYEAFAIIDGDENIVALKLEFIPEDRGDLWE